MATLNGYDFHLLRAVIEVNARQRLLPVRALKQHLGSLEGCAIAVLGLTFKPDTDDIREAPATEIISLLRAEGAEVAASIPIPVAIPELAESAESIEEAVAGADAVDTRHGMGGDRARRLADTSSPRWPANPSSSTDATRSIPLPIRDAGGKYIGVGRPPRGASPS